ncbi:MAG: hypothetical protein RLZZ33_611 [Pseudomonadota bacterium]|jgi:hypothetical protein
MLPGSPVAIKALQLQPVQLAYHVPDARSAALDYSRRFGWGPFYLMERIALSESWYRGVARPFVHSSAYGQAGDMMIELISQADDSPSVLREQFARDQSGLHHVACFVDDLAVSINQLETDGFATALSARTATGVSFTMIDTRRVFGHFLELYEPSDALRDFYRFVARKADGWDGQRPLRELQNQRSSGVNS